MKKFFREVEESIPSIVFAEISPQGFSEITDQNEIESLKLSREINQRKSRRNYGFLLSEIISSQLRIFRVSTDPSLLFHSQIRSSLYLNLETLKNSVSSGNFLDAYEDLNSINAQEGLTESQISYYRILLSLYIVSTSNYVDPIGNSVEGGQYDELTSKTIDAQGFIL